MVKKLSLVRHTKFLLILVFYLDNITSVRFSLNIGPRDFEINCISYIRSISLSVMFQATGDHLILQL